MTQKIQAPAKATLEEFTAFMEVKSVTPPLSLSSAVLETIRNEFTNETVATLTVGAYERFSSRPYSGNSP